MTSLKALDKSITHWAKNLELALKGKLQINNIDALKCALCHKFLGMSNVVCFTCPLKAYGGACDMRENNPWGGVWKAIHHRNCCMANADVKEANMAKLNAKIVHKTEIMLTFLLIVREALKGDSGG